MKGTLSVKAILKALGVTLILAVFIGVSYLISQRDALLERFLKEAVPYAEKMAPEFIGTQIKIGKAEVEHWSWSKLLGSGVILRDIEVFDRDSEVMAKVDEAKVSFRLLAFLDDGAGAVDEINLNGAQLHLKKRADNSWNINDIKPKSSGESTFGAKIFLKDGVVDAAFDGHNVTVENISAEADCANLKAIKTKVSAETLGSKIDASGTVGAETQILNANVDRLDAAKILPFIPADIIPENIEIHGGIAENARVNLFRHDEVLSYSGSTDFHGGAVKVEDTEIENIHGSASFTDAEFRVNAAAQANGQTARASGVIRTDTDEPFFDVDAASDYFVPEAIIPNIGIKGAAKFTAHLTGTAQNPQVEADISSNYLAYENISAQNIQAHLQYVNNAVNLSDIYAEAFGGAIRGEAEVQAQKLAYNAHVRADGINIAQVRNWAGVDVNVNGDVSADVAVNGLVTDLKTLKVFGQASANNVTYENFAVEGVESSFYLSDNDLKFDYLSVRLPNRGKFNIEGTVMDRNRLDLDFYGSHIDLAMAKEFNELVDVSGLSDFKGAVHGDIENPQIELNLSAVDSAQRGGERLKGVVFNQPYDSMKLAASGNLDGISVDEFEIEKDGKVTWTVIDGIVSLKDEHRINLRLDTIGARVEDIIALVTDAFNVTGNIDNTIRITGTIEKPRVVGYVEFDHGSFKYEDFDTILLTSMRGDYFVEGSEVRLQDFVITSPMVDMVLNGTIDRNNYDMNFVVEGRDIDLRRFQAKFPNNYPVGGHGTFEGIIGGNMLKNQTFDGKIVSPSMNFNGVELKSIQAHIGASNTPGKGTQIVLDDCRFLQGDGKYELLLRADTAAKKLSGKVDVKNADIPALVALANKKTDILTGKLNSEITLGGSTENPSGTLKGSISKGKLAGYDLHDVNVDVNLLNGVVYVQQFAGKQGDSGEFKISGTAGLSGPLDLKGTARHIELAMIGAAAGLDVVFTGFTNLSAKVQGNLDNPTGEVRLTANGGIKGSTFDLMTAHVLLKDWIFDVQELSVKRTINNQLYQASAQGTIPIQALYIDSGERVAPTDQMNLQVILEDADLSLLPVMHEMVAWAVGKMDGGVTITGTASAPQINGQISVNDGSVKIKGMNNLIEHINISTLFRGNRFDIDQFVGNIGAGTFKVDGGFSFANYTVSNYNFDLTADALDIKSIVFTGPLNAEFNVSEARLRDRTLPKITGVVDLDKCLFSIPTIPDSDEPLPDVLMDVTLNLGEKVHFYSARLYNMFLTGSVKFERSTQHPKTSGIVSVKRGGTVNYLQTVFDIREGEALFNQLESFFPSLHFVADTRLANAKINLSIDGALGDAKIRLSSTPEMSETEIMQVLTMRDAYGNSTSNMTAADVLAIGLQLSVLGDIEDTVRRTLGFDRFTFASGSGSAFENEAAENNAEQNEFNISVGKYVSDKFMLRYTQGITGDKIARYGFQYDLSDNFGVTVERENSNYIFSLEARYKF